LAAQDPEFPVKAMAEKGRKTDALSMTDIVKAIQAAYIQIVSAAHLQ
jgi:hypothetical protein